MFIDDDDDDGDDDDDDDDGDGDETAGNRQKQIILSHYWGHNPAVSQAKGPSSL